jgi:hypothetical protein
MSAQAAIRLAFACPLLVNMCANTESCWRTLDPFPAWGVHQVPYRVRCHSLLAELRGLCMHTRYGLMQDIGCVVTCVWCYRATKNIDYHQHISVTVHTAMR